MGIETLFEGQELSEEFKTKVATVFEATVAEAVAVKEAELTEAVEAKITEIRESHEAEIAQLKEQAETQLAELEEAYGAEIAELSEGYEEYVTKYVQESVVDKVDAFMNYVADQWMEENKLAVERGLKSEMVESFLSGMHTLFAEHYVDLPEDKVDVVEEMAARMEELESRLNATLEENVTMKNFLREKAKQEIVSEVAEGLADTQVERLETIAEGIAFGDADQFRKKLEVVRDTMVVESRQEAPAPAKAAPEKETLTEGYNDMSSLISELTRLAGKK